MHLINISVALLAFAAWTSADVCPSTTSSCVTSVNPETELSGSNGSLKNPSVLSRCDTTQFFECRDGCFELPDCKSFSYASGNSTCTYYSKRLIVQEYRKPLEDRGVTFYNGHCFVQACCASSQLIENESFEKEANDGSLPPWSFQITEGSDSTANAGQYCGSSPDGSCHAFFSVNKPSASSSITITQNLELPSACSSSVPFSFSAYFGEYSSAGTTTSGTDFTFSVSLDDQIVIASGEPICNTDNPCELYNSGRDAYRLVTASGTTENRSPVLKIEFHSPGGVNQFEAALLDQVLLTVEPGV